MKHKKWILLFCVLWAVVWSFGFAVVAQVQFLCVDDKYINFFAQNEYGEYLVFINILIGYIMRFFYLLVPNVNIFFIFMFGLEALLFAVLYYCVAEEAILKRQPSRGLYGIAFLSVLEILFTVNFTYTILASLLAAAGVLIFCFQIEKRRWAALGIVFIFLGFCIRMPSSLIGCILASPAAVFVSKKSWKKLLRYGMICLGMCIVAALLHRSIYYQNNWWKAELERLEYRLVDYTPLSYQQHAQELETIGISENDLSCYYSWVFADSEVFSVEKLAAMDKILGWQGKYDLNLISVFSQALKQKEFWIFLIFAAGATVSVIFDKNKKLKVALALVLIFSAGGMLGLIIRQRAMYHVLWMVFYTGLLVMVTLLSLQKDTWGQKRKEHLAAGIGFLVFAALAVQKTSTYINIYQNRIVDSAAKAAELVQWQQKNPDIVLAMDTMLANVFLNVSVYEDTQDPYWEQRIKMGSWDMGGQRWASALERQEIDPNHLLLSAANRDDVYVLVGSQSMAEKLEIFMEEHIGEEIECSLVERLNNSGWEIYSYRTVEPYSA